MKHIKRNQTFLCNSTLGMFCVTDLLLSFSVSLEASENFGSKFSQARNDSLTAAWDFYFSFVLGFLS